MYRHIYLLILALHNLPVAQNTIWLAVTRLIKQRHHCHSPTPAEKMKLLAK